MPFRRRQGFRVLPPPRCSRATTFHPGNGCVAHRTGVYQVVRAGPGVLLGTRVPQKEVVLRVLLQCGARGLLAVGQLALAVGRACCHRPLALTTTVRVPTRRSITCDSRQMALANPCECMLCQSLLAPSVAPVRACSRLAKSHAQEAGLRCAPWRRHAGVLRAGRLLVRRRAIHRACLCFLV